MQLLERVVSELGAIDGVDAIVLGGSHATGTASPASDYDIGIYYGSSQPLDLVSLNMAASRLDDHHRDNLVGSPGSWGPWVNAGGWLTIDGIAVDLILRETARVAKVAEDCRNGIIQLEYQLGHPFGFLSSIYVGELLQCTVLSATNNELEELRRSASEFPPAYQHSMYERFGFSAWFYLMCARKGIQSNDIPFVSGCLFHASLSLVQVLFAANRQYLLNEKGWQKRVAAIPDFWMPDKFVELTEHAFSLLNQGSAHDACALIEQQATVIRQHLGLPAPEFR